MQWRSNSQPSRARQVSPLPHFVNKVALAELLFEVVSGGFAVTGEIGSYHASGPIFAVTLHSHFTCRSLRPSGVRDKSKYAERWPHSEALVRQMASIA